MKNSLAARNEFDLDDQRLSSSSSSSINEKTIQSESSSSSSRPRQCSDGLLANLSRSILLFWLIYSKHFFCYFFISLLEHSHPFSSSTVSSCLEVFVSRLNRSVLNIWLLNSFEVFPMISIHLSSFCLIFIVIWIDSIDPRTSLQWISIEVLLWTRSTIIIWSNDCVRRSSKRSFFCSTQKRR